MVWLVAVWFGLNNLTAIAWIQSVVGRLRSPASHMAWQKKKKKKTQKVNNNK